MTTAEVLMKLLREIAHERDVSRPKQEDFENEGEFEAYVFGYDEALDVSRYLIKKELVEIAKERE